MIYYTLSTGNSIVGQKKWKRSINKLKSDYKYKRNNQ